MKKNKMLSLAAAMILTSTAAMAFDTQIDGNISTLTNRDDNTTVVSSGYYDGNVSAQTLQLSGSQYGDALIYPAFQSANGWDTEFSVRNTSDDQAMIAKVVVYGADKTEELLDFNIYLSNNDVFKFNIKDGIVTTEDASTPIRVSNPRDGVTKDKVTFNTRGNKFQFNATPLKETEGYVVIYGMAMSQLDNNTTADGSTSGTYHKNHVALWEDYRIMLDECRPGWRNVYEGDNAMVNGMVRQALRAPNIELNASCGQNDASRGMFENPAANLVGMTRITNTTDKSRDLMLPAVALANFTSDDVNMSMLWLEGEFASIADRDINGTGFYDEAQVKLDAAAFNTSSANVEFNENRDAETTLLVTQPFKRTLVQLGDDSNTYTGETVNKANPNDYFNGYYGAFTVNYSVYDLEEGTAVAPSGDGALTSPYTGGSIDPDSYKKELQAIPVAKMLEGAREIGFDSKEGFAKVSFSVPAIVTQMNGGETTGDAQTNWTYTPAK